MHLPVEEAAETIQTDIVEEDYVSEVLNIKGEDMEDTPAFGTKTNTDYILVVAKMEGGVKIFLSIDYVLSCKQIEIIKNVG